MGACFNERLLRAINFDRLSNINSASIFVSDRFLFDFDCMIIVLMINNNNNNNKKIKIKKKNNNIIIIIIII